MPEEIDLQKLKEENPEFFEKTSPEVIKFIFSDKTSEKIADIAVKNGVIEEEKIEGIAYRVTLVLLNRISKESLAMAVELELKIPAETARKIGDELNQLITPIKTNSSQSEKELHKGKTIEEKPKRPSSKDAYREKIE